MPSVRFGATRFYAVPATACTDAGAAAFRHNTGLWQRGAERQPQSARGQAFARVGADVVRAAGCQCGVCGGEGGGEWD